MNTKLVERLQYVTELTPNIYHSLIKEFGKERIHEVVDYCILCELKKDSSYNNQVRLWNCFGYYLSTFEHSVCEKFSLDNLDELKKKRDYTSLEKRKSKKDLLTLEEERIYGFHLLAKPYIELLVDKGEEQDNYIEIDLIKLFSSIKSKEVALYIIEKFRTFYNNFDRNSYFDSKMLEILDSYEKLCVKYKRGVPTNNALINMGLYDENKIIDEDYLVEQVDMYIRYSIARETFINGNMAFITKKAYAFVDDDFSFDDAYQEGYLALLQVVDKFDIRKNFTFTNYADKGLFMYLRTAYIRRTKLFSGAHKLETLKWKLGKSIGELSQKLGRYPTDCEIALDLDISMIRLNEVYRYIEVMYKGTSLNKNVYSDDESETILHDQVADSKINLEDDYIEKDTVNIFMDIINNDLSLQERKLFYDLVIYNKNGEQIGREENVTREAIRQRKNKLCKILSKNDRASWLDGNGDWRIRL